jgi:carboxylate-amine ligase
VEIRVFDTPLTVERAAALAAYAQALARWLVTERPLAATRELYLLYNYNRFQACRYGLEGRIIDPAHQRQASLKEDIIETAGRIARHAVGAGAAAAIQGLAGAGGEGDAGWLRQVHRERGSLHDVARRQSELWMGRGAEPARAGSARG